MALATKVIMPALGMAQESGRLVRWLKPEGASVNKGEPIMQIETDKVTVDIGAPATGSLAGVTAAEGDDVPVGQAVAVILAPGETPGQAPPHGRDQTQAALESEQPLGNHALRATPVARRLARQHDVPLQLVRPEGGVVRKADVLRHLERHGAGQGGPAARAAADGPARLSAASPKARRLAAERGLDVAALSGRGPEGAVLASDVLEVAMAPRQPGVGAQAPEGEILPVSGIWRVMVDRLTRSWASVPHFHLVREVNASRLLAWRERLRRQEAEAPTISDLLVYVTAAALRRHPRLNASWTEDAIRVHQEVHVGLAVAIDEGLVAPVIHHADRLGYREISARRRELVRRARERSLRPEDMEGGTFTISNLGMYGVDAFNAIINPPQAAILAVGRIVDRVVPVDRQPAVQPMVALTLSVDHRVADGARAAEFLDTLALFIEEPLALFNPRGPSSGPARP